MWGRLLGCLICLLLGVSLASATEEQPTLGLDGVDVPRLGEPVRVLISHASYPELERFQVRVTYHPNSQAAREELLPAPSDFGVVQWTPAEAGPVLLTAEAPALEDFEAVRLTLEVSVEGEGGPSNLGLILALLAALLLCGGLAWTILKRTGSSPAQND